LLVNPDFVSLDALREAVGDSVSFVEVDPEEPLAANIVRVGERHAIFPAAFPKTLKRIRAARQRLAISVVPADELAKVDGAVTCCSLIFQTQTP
jgi:dimethylargininase